MTDRKGNELQIGDMVYLFFKDYNEGQAMILSISEENRFLSVRRGVGDRSIVSPNRVEKVTTNENQQTKD